MVKVRRQRKVEDLLKIFCNGGKAVRIKGTPIVVYRGEFFLRVKELSEDVRKIIRMHNAKIVAEYDDNGEVVGFAIVPNVGFEQSMEQWFLSNGISLIKKLAKLLNLKRRF